MCAVDELSDQRAATQNGYTVQDTSWIWDGSADDRRLTLRYTGLA